MTHFINEDSTKCADPFALVHAVYVDAKRQKLLKRLRLFDSVTKAIYEVPEGHISDGRSVPWWTGIGFMLYGGRNSPGAWVHDKLYASAEVPREVADRIFRDALLAEGERPSAAAVMYRMVRMFGGWGYKDRPTAAQEQVEDQNPHRVGE